MLATNGTAAAPAAAPPASVVAVNRTAVYENVGFVPPYHQENEKARPAYLSLSEPPL